MKHDMSTILSRKLGKLPDKFWYQLNGKSAQENLEEQRERSYSDLKEEESDELQITSETNY